ncbi:MAG: single-stranded DNA-binding protein [Firmicutes bacterium]|nr:single-stranded DNA-binding protein [Bacillota bacterium]
MTDRFIVDGRLDREGVIAALDGFLRRLLRATGLQLRYEFRTLEPLPDEVEQPELLVNFYGRDENLLTERGAELLKAIEYVAHRWLRLDPQYYDRVLFECGEWRQMRLEELKLAARVAAQRVRETRQPFRFNPMPARERRVLHLALKDEPGVRTSSEGTGPQRQVIVFPA